MEYSVHENLRHYGIKPILYYCVEIKISFFDFPHIVQLNPLNEFQSQDSFSCELVVNVRDVHGLAALEILVEPFCISGFKLEIQLFFGPFFEFINNFYRPELFHILQAVLGNTGKIPHNLNVSLHYFPDIGPLYLDGNLFPGFQYSPVNLAYRSRCHGCFFKACKNVPYFFAEFFFKNLPDMLERKGRNIILQLLKLFCILFRHQVWPHAQQLAELNERRP